MKILIIGSTGMLGQALTREAEKRGLEVVGLARSNADICIDITDEKLVIDAVRLCHPDTIINTAAVTSLALCEKDPFLAYRVNTRSVSVIAETARNIDAYLIQISTDHYFTGDRDAKHTESSPIYLVNEYARSKFAGEYFALTCPNALVVRTNIVGFRGKKGQLTFIEWVFQAIENKMPMTLFNDFFTSSISVSQFSTALFNMMDKHPSGILNLASSEVFNKQQFIESIAAHLGSDLSHAKTGSVFDLVDAVRAESLGLNVSKAENILGQKLPTMSQVVDSLISEYEGIANEI